jgi:uncharacterized repeat protein (TIGR01451 family)
MKVTKKSLVGIASVAGALTLGAGALFWGLPGNAQEETAETEGTTPAGEVGPLLSPIPDSGRAFAFQSDVQKMPSPSQTVRGNDAFDRTAPSTYGLSDATAAVSDAPASPYAAEAGQYQPDQYAPRDTQYAQPAPPAFAQQAYDSTAGVEAYAPQEYRDVQSETYAPASESPLDNGGNRAGFTPPQPLDFVTSASPEPVDYAAAPPTDYAPPANSIRQPAPISAAASQPFDPSPQYAPAQTVDPIVAPEEFMRSVGTPLQSPIEESLLAEGKPGSPQLEGVQTLSVSVEKTGPEEIQVEIPATFQVKVQNVGNSRAHAVTLTDRIPDGTEFMGAEPTPREGPGGVLVWELGELAPGEERIINLELLPKAEGEIGSVAQVSFQALASVRSTCTKPKLEIKHTAPTQVLIGEDVVFAIRISNPGSGAATGVVIDEDVPTGLIHAAGSALESEIGTLEPGEVRQMELLLKADSPGLVQNKIRVRGNGNLFDDHVVNVEVVAPQLQVQIDGPTQRYLERPVTYDIAFHNPGTAPAKNLNLVTRLPKGLEFVSANNKGRYDARSHAVQWSLIELPAGEKGAVQLTGLPLETGAQLLRLEANADGNLTGDAELTTQVAALTELEFSVSDVQDPIEINSETTYEIRVVNNGAKAAQNIEVFVKLPREITAITADGATRAKVEPHQVIMEPIRELAPRADAVYRIKVRGLAEGDHIVEVFLRSDEVTTAVMKQESTKVYDDRQGQTPSTQIQAANQFGTSRP